MPLTDAQALDLYVQAVQSEAAAAVCAPYRSWYITEFDAKYQVWRKANADDLARGARLAEAKGIAGDEPEGVKAAARAKADAIHSLPVDERKRTCEGVILLYTPQSK